MRHIKFPAALFTLALITAACGGSPPSEPAPTQDPGVVAEPAAVAEETGHAGTAEAADHSAAADDHAADEAHTPSEPAHGSHEDESAKAASEEIAAGFDRQVEVVMSEFVFEPEAITVGAGETVLFVIANNGIVPHEFRLTTPHAVEEHLASGHEGHSTGGHHDETLVVVEPGATETLEVTFAEDGEFSLVACLIPGHYEAGMFADLQYG